MSVYRFYAFKDMYVKFKTFINSFKNLFNLRYANEYIYFQVNKKKIGIHLLRFAINLEEVNNQ